MPQPDRAAAFAHCLRIAREHYENFPVASRMLPKKYRGYIAAIYTFARVADDYADEGEWPVSERLNALALHEEKLDRAIRGEATEPAFVALGITIEEAGIPDRLLRDLLTAFRHDARNRGYRTMEDLLAYCRNSANPIGRLVLHLYGYTSEEQLRLSDEICTGLQLVNFWQDVSIDLPRDRVTIPAEVMERSGYSEEELRTGVQDDRFVAMMKELVDEAEGYLLRGSGLPAMIPSWRLRWQLKLTVAGGLTVAEKIRGIDFRVLEQRVVVKRTDFSRLLRHTTHSS